jgi:hypothetical protein
VTPKQAVGSQVQVAADRDDQTEAPTAIERAARREAARNNAADSKLSDVSSLRVGPVAGVTRTVALYRRLGAEWDVTAERYRAVVPELTSVDSWEQMFKCGEPPRCP